MPFDPIIGRDVLLYFLINGIYQQAACATEITFNTHTDTVEVTTKTNNQGQGSWRKVKPIFNSWSASVSGIQMLDTPVKFSDIRQMQTDLNTVYIQVAKVSKSGTRYENWFGAGVITDTNETAGTDEFAQFDIQIEGYGALRADFDPTNVNEPIEMFYYYECTGSEGRSWIIPALQGQLISGRIYREGLEVSASGVQTMNRPATDPPAAGKYQWDSSQGRITLSPNDAPTSAGERIDIPFTRNYSGCSLAINNFKAALNSNNEFVLSWQGTGIPKNQLLFEYSADFGATYNILGVELDPVNLDNAIVTEDLITSASFIFSLTPVCTNQMNGKTSTASWNYSLVNIISSRTDILINEVFYKDSVNTQYGILTSDVHTQLTAVSGTKTPYNANSLTVYMVGGIPFNARLTVKNKAGDILGTTTKTVAFVGDFAIVPLTSYLPNEFTVVLD